MVDIETSSFNQAAGDDSGGVTPYERAAVSYLDVLYGTN